jgi:hypothetical protein
MCLGSTRAQSMLDFSPTISPQSNRPARCRPIELLPKRVSQDYRSEATQTLAR